LTSTILAAGTASVALLFATPPAGALLLACRYHIGDLAKAVHASGTGLAWFVAPSSGVDGAGGKEKSTERCVLDGHCLVVLLKGFEL